MNLVEVQSLFWRAMRHPLAPPAAIDATFRGDDRLSAGNRVGIYRGMYFVRQTEALRQDFPRLARRLGEDTFRRVCRDYVLAHPSEDPRLELLGRYMARFLRGHADAAVAVHADLATFEWAEVEALISEDPPALLRHIGVPGARFPHARLMFVPSCRLLSLDTDPDPGATGPLAPALFLVWRKGFAVFHARPETDEFQAAQLAQAGATLAQICAPFAAAPDPARRAADTLAAWIAGGLVSRIVDDEAGDP